MATAKVRPMTKRDLARAERIWVTSYLLEGAQGRETIRSRMRLADCRVLEVDGTVHAVGRLLPLKATLNGRVLDFGAVAWLATAPEARRRRYMQTLLLDMLREMRKCGMVLSGLYPFDSAFYRRYGWALADGSSMVEVPARYLTVRGRSSGTVVDVGVGSVKSLLKLHTEWGTRHNLSVVRDRWWFEKYVLYDGLPGAAPRYVYRYEAPNGVPEGYVILRYNKSRPPARVLEFVALTPRARAGLLAFLGDLDSQSKDIQFLLPADDPLRAQLGRYDEIREERGSSYQAMLRIVDVAGVFKGWNLPGGDATVTMAVDDPHARWNHGGWKLAVAGGKSKIARSKAAADCRLSIRTLAQLVSGFLSAEAAVHAGLVTGPRPEKISLIKRFSGDRTPFHNDFY